MINHNLSNLNVSLTYLRGLEVAELKEEEMPIFLLYLISFVEFQ